MKQGALVLSCLLCGTFASAASAKPHHHRSSVQPFYEAEPYGGNGDGAPIYYRAPFVGAPPVAVVISRGGSQCEYPNGFNVTHFDRSLQGIPRSGSELIASGCAASIPF